MAHLESKVLRCTLQAFSQDHTENLKSATLP